MTLRIKKIATIDTLEMKPRHYQENGDPNNGQGYNYLWQLIGLEKYAPEFEGMNIIKDGYAKEFYSTGHNGLFQRVRTTVREFEKSYCNGEFGALKAEVYGNICKDANRSLAQEQYYHKRNQGQPFHLLPLILKTSGGKAPAGKTEFYNLPLKSAMGKYYQSMTKKAIGEGWQDIVDQKFRGQSGWRLPIVSRRLEI